jgi:transposase, IS5 family
MAGDRGLYSVENERLSRQAGVERVVLPKSGKLSERRNRAFGLDVWLDHAEEGIERWVGWGILAHNLRQTARTQVAQQAA